MPGLKTISVSKSYLAKWPGFTKLCAWSPRQFSRPSVPDLWGPNKLGPTVCSFRYFIYVVLYVHLLAAHTEGSSAVSNYSSSVSDMFKEPMFIAVAYSKLFNHLCTVMKDCDMSALKVALINQAHTPDGVMLEKSTKDEIKLAKSIDDLLYAFDDPSCCNWLNTRLLEVLANCSSPIAVKAISAYKHFLFAKRLKEVLPKRGHQSKKKTDYITAVSTKVNVDPDKLTVGDFMRHYENIEEVVLELGKQILNIEHVEDGCLEAYYTMPVHCSFNAYKMALYNQQKFYTIDLMHIEIGEHPVIFDPWLSNFKQLSTKQTIHAHYEGKSLH